MVMKKLIVCLAILALTGNALFAGGARGGGAAPGQLTEISAMVWDRGTTPADQGTIDNNWWTRYVDEQVAPLGARMRWVAIPRAQEAQMLSTMLAANNAPDISKTNDIALLKTYMTGGGIADITGYVNSFGAHIKALYGDTILKDAQYDGKIYWLPHIGNGFSRTTWIRKDWLDAVGMDSPSTPEEFYQVLKAIKEKDPGKVGPALVPLGMVGQQFALWNLIVLPGFVKNPPSPDRFLVPFPMWPEAKDALGWLNKLYNEGLVTDEFILDKDESLFRQKIARGEMFAFLMFGHYPYHSAYGGLYDKLRETDPNAQLASIDTFKQSKNAERIEYYDSNPIYVYRWFVPSSSKNTETAVKILNWMASPEGYMVGGLGVEGQDYRLVDKVPVPINNQTYLARVPWIEAQHGLMAKPYPGVQEKDLFLTNYIKDFNPIYYDQIKREAYFLSDLKYFEPTIPFPTPVSDRARPALTSFWNDEIAKIITASPANFDRVFDTTIRQYREMGGDDLVAETQRLYGQMR
jgi:putative aldouronate transport system substrate-binding protein